MACPLPETFGRYQILRPLGEGGMGSVYLARDSQLDRLVALKVPRLGGDDQPAAGELQRFFREARAAAALLHPNLCPIFDVGEVDGTPYLTMAYLEGRLLSDLIEKDKPRSQRQAAQIVRKLASAVQAAHARGVIHRDLKPANVMIGARGEPVVLDFGLARREETAEARLTKDGTVLGTPAYMAPEQVRGETRAIGPACDIYALGVILYELVTGRLPFEGSVLTILGKVLTEEPPPPSRHRPDLDPTLEAICLKAMAKKAEDRYASMAELAAALAAQLRAMRETPRPAASAQPAAQPGSQPRAGGDPAATLQPEALRPGRATERPPLPVQAPPPRPGWRDAEPKPHRTRPRRTRWLAYGAAVGAVPLLWIGYAAFEGGGPGGIQRNRGGPNAPVDQPPPARLEPRPGPPRSNQVARKEPGPEKGEAPAPQALDQLAQTQPVSPTPRKVVNPQPDRAGIPSPALATTRSNQAAPSETLTHPKTPPVAVPSTPGDLARKEPPPEVRKPAGQAPNAVVKIEPEPKPETIPPVVVTTKAEPSKEKPRTVVDPEFLTTRIGRITLRRIPAGTFGMGSPGSEGFPNEHPRRAVRISRAFYLGVFEVTQAQYRAVMAENPSYFAGAGRGRDKVAHQATHQHPVDNVSWLDAVRFCNILSEREELEPFYEIDEEKVQVPDWNGTGYRLPTEAEWEYACRGGSATRYSFGDREQELGESAWYERLAGGQTHPVGQKRPNAWGLYDLHGNVWEWCWDWYGANTYQHPPHRDPVGPPSGTHRVLRGGSFHDYPAVLRSATRGRDAPANRDRVNGLRIARS